MKKLYSKWSGEEYQVPELIYKVHFKRTKTVEAKIRRYEKNHTAYFLTTNALEDKKIRTKKEYLQKEKIGKLFPKKK